MTVALELELDPRIHFAMQQNAVPVVKRLGIRNDGDEEVHDLEVEITIGADLAAPWRRRIDRLPPGATHHLDPVDLALDGVTLRAQTERERTELRVVVRAGRGDAAETIATDERPVEVFAFREWAGLRSLPELLASFVLPNARAVQDLLGAATGPLREATGRGALDGYQARDPERVRAILEALFAALCAVGIDYASPPASFEQEGQRVRLPGDVCEQRLGTCLDLALVYAALCEQAGLHPLVVIVDGHAFAGCWLLPETFAEAALEDGLRVRKRADLDEIVLVETTLATRDHDGDFERATRAARTQLEDLDRFRVAIDVAQARRLGFRPLPLREQDTADAPASVARPAVVAPPPAEPASAPPPRETPVAPATAPVAETRLDRWRRRLLDLTYRNRGIAFRETKRSIPLYGAHLDRIEDALSGGGRFEIRPLPDRGPRDEAIEAARDGEDPTARFVRDELGARRIYTPLTPAELERRLLEIWRYSRTAFEESGAHVLHLALGMLVYYESSSSQTERKAPILLLPLRVERVSATAGFRVLLGDEEPQVNVTLLEKLRAEFPIDVRGLDELVEDDSGVDVAETLTRFRRAVRDVDRWEVRDEAWIAPFLFTKFLMWLDLRERADSLLESPVLRHLVEQPGAAFEPDAPFVEPDELDDALPPQDALCPLDADSSQLAAVHAATEGRSFVLEGPPGTGKSQTITNLIAHSIGAGKRVLFVSEKVAALEVVHRRLERVGLGPFCLELHSNRASKRQVLDQLMAPFSVARTREPADWERHAERLERLRSELNGYVRALHRPRAFGESIYRATSRLAGLADVPRVVLAIEAAGAVDVAWVEARRRVVDQLAGAADDVWPPGEHAFAASDLRVWEPALPDRLDPVLDAARDALAVLAGAAASQPLPIDAAALPRAAFGHVVELARRLLDTPGPAPELLTAPGFAALRERALAWIEDGRQKDALRDHVRQAFQDRVLELDLDDLHARLVRGIGSFWPLSWLRCRSVRKVLRGVAKGGHLGSHAEVSKHLEQAIELRAKIAALADPAHPANALLGSTRWAAGDPGDWGALAAMVEWAGRFRATLARLGDELSPDAADALRARAIALATDGSDALDVGRRDGDALRELVAAAEGFASRRHELVEMLVLDADRAFAANDVHAPWLAACRARLEQWRGCHRAQLEDWCWWRRVRGEAAALGLEPLVLAAEAGTLSPARLAEGFERAFREAWLLAIGEVEPEIGGFHSKEHERKIARFAELDRELIHVSQQVLRARLCARVPSFDVSAAESSEMGILQREARKKRRHLPVRRLFQALPNLLPRLKPCVLMSPLSVAQYLRPGSLGIRPRRVRRGLADPAVGRRRRDRARALGGRRRRLEAAPADQLLPGRGGRRGARRGRRRGAREHPRRVRCGRAALAPPRCGTTAAGTRA